MDTLAWLIAIHLLCDYPLQGEFIARGKSHVAPLPGVPWWLILTSHAFIHGAGVGLLLPQFAAAEMFAHWCIDFAKTQGWLGKRPQLAFVIDQGLHVLCKCAWVGLS